MPQNTRRYFEESEQLLEGKKPEGPEFAALMRSKIGGRFKDLVTPERLGMMALIGDPRAQDWSVAGVNFPTGLDNPKNIERMREAVAPVLAETGQELPKGKRIFGVGSQADAATYAHELRHEAVQDEMYNRVLDFIHGSTSRPAYKTNVDRVYRYLVDFDENAIANTPYADKERKVLDTIKWMAKEEANQNDMGFWNTLLSGDFVEKNMELNKAGAVGGFLNGEKLPNHVIQYRAKLPFLNFVGSIEDTKSRKKAVGGMVENTTHDRKII